MPAGNLRESLSSLRRASVVVLREEEAQQLAALVASRTKADLWIIRRALRLPPEMPSKPIAFCAIARPANFFAMLAQAGCRTTGQVHFPDHHAYRREDFERLAAAGHERGADGFVTTAKDAVKISPADRALLAQVGPVTVAELHLSLVEPEPAWQQICRMLGRPPGEPPLREKMGG